MTLLELDDTELSAYSARADRISGETAGILPLGDVHLEDAEVVFGLVALHGDSVVAELPLKLRTRLRVDDTVHLWSDGVEPLSASMVLDRSDSTMRINLHLQVAGRSARQTRRAAQFLQTTATDGTHLSFRLPDGSLATERMPLPEGLAVDEGLVRLMQLLCDVAELSGVGDVTVPDDVDNELIKDLLTARKLLLGQEVAGSWNQGTLRLEGADFDGLRELLAVGSRHELAIQHATYAVRIGDTELNVGEVRQVFHDAVVEETESEGEVLILRVRSYDTKGRTWMTPLGTGVTAVVPRVILDDDVFDELARALDLPAAYSPMRDLL